MKILITHFFSKKNNGDAALMLVLLGQLRQAFPKPALRLVTTDRVGGWSEFDGVPEDESFFYLAIYTSKNPLSRAIKTVYIIWSTLFWAEAYRLWKIKLNFLLSFKARLLMEDYLTADAVVACGGGYIIGGRGMRNHTTVALHLHALLVAKLLGKKFILYSQSVGPFSSHFQSYLTRQILNLSGAVLCREEISEKLLLSTGVKKQLVHRAVDAAFLFVSRAKNKMLGKLKSLGVKNGKLAIGITVLNWLKPPGQEKFELAIAQFADYLVGRGASNIIFIPQVTSSVQNDDDRLVNRRIKELMKTTADTWLLEQEFNCEDIKGIYENLDFLIGSRTHSCIFSLTGMTPVLAIQYQHKTLGIMQDLGLSKWVIKMEDVTKESLQKKFQLLEAEKENYLSTLSLNLPNYLKRARQAAEIIKEVL